MIPGMTLRDCQATELRRQELLAEVARARWTADQPRSAPRSPRLAAAGRALGAIVVACSTWVAAHRPVGATTPAD